MSAFNCYIVCKEKELKRNTSRLKRTTTHITTETLNPGGLYCLEVGGKRGLYYVEALKWAMKI